uniref:Uncharacterized protein n=1 Tax=Nelumbo nucifera TaxID=4432 RepID=A0A822Z5N4_NELNU|nr:TPA_asm: hypothetical protein HUJ06_013077 [Nelumbo nucifera]
MGEFLRFCRQSEARGHCLIP